MRSNRFIFSKFLNSLFLLKIQITKIFHLLFSQKTTQKTLLQNKQFFAQGQNLNFQSFRMSNSRSPRTSLVKNYILLPNIAAGEFIYVR